MARFASEVSNECITTGIRDPKAHTNRPPEEWAKTSISAIIDAATLECVRAKQESRAPSRTPPRLVNSPTLLTGLLKCKCGAGMTLATGKSGLYKCYKCTHRHSQGNHACTSHNLPMEKLDGLVLNQLAEKIFAPERLHVMMAELLKRIKLSKDMRHWRKRCGK